MRNQYETRIGKFKGAVDPSTTAFREFPAWVGYQFQLAEQSKAELECPNGNTRMETPRVAMYCTGGIRCEKASSLLLGTGFREVLEICYATRLFSFFFFHR